VEVFLFRSIRRSVAGLLAAFIAIQPAWSGVKIDGTRVIYNAADREVTVKLANMANDPVLMQVWVDRGNVDSAPDTSDAPFVVVPPIFRLDPQRAQSVRLTFTGEALPQDRESLFWFNALEVPPLPSDRNVNTMQIAVRTRLKMFYRPTGLAGDLPSAVAHVAWQIVPGEKGAAVLRGKNDSPYHVSYSVLTVEQGGRSYDTGGGMIKPFSSQDFSIPGFTAQGSDVQLRFRWMSDYGVSPEQLVPLH